MHKRSRETTDVWVIRFEGSEFGPFSAAEALNILESGALKGQVQAARFGSKQWHSVGAAMSILQNPFGFNDQSYSEYIYERRKQIAIRCPLVATASIKKNGTLQTLGVLVNISRTGIQVLNAGNIEVSVGDRIELVVHFVTVKIQSNLETSAEVIWVTQDPPKIGIKFSNPIQSPEINSLLKEKISVL